MEKVHRSGFVNIIGKPNVGKSTLMNSLVGEKLSGITSKAQTTRHRIMGIVNSDDFQIVYSDTPGILEPTYKLQESMLSYVNQAFQDADIFLYVVELKENPQKNPEIAERLNRQEVPVLLVINKIDLDVEGKLEEIMETWQQILPKAIIVPVSALAKFNLEKLFAEIVERLPESPPYFSKEAITDKSERFIVSEVIREKILLNYKKEIPYSVEIEIESFKESDDIIKISSIIYVERDSQKGIIIGSKGSMLKRVGTLSRKELEKFFDKKIFLELFVKVNKNWRNSEKELKRFGYIKK